MYQKTILSALVVAIVSLGNVAGEDVDVSKLPAAAGNDVDFVKEIKPLFEKSCFGCHGSKPRAKSKYFMNKRATTLEGGSSKEAAVIAGKSAASPLVHFIGDLVEELEMPPLDKREKYAQLTKDQIGLVRAWIDQGAKWPDGVELAMPK
ncbi:hypothetical protein N8494_00245 [bacterium]|jgi:hypothetical protein|nr:hypothetical protein [Verrucomicrobiota bacterium]MDA7497124.1 hypothetical protein [bacterium]MDA7511032.1 hypothetical protein [Verrucomicrobiota bacterium]MDA7632873.1 hypothetical protein [bacterium]MDA7657221.1 hypothetical protein [Verrucomicrobiota bacterium]